MLRQAGVSLFIKREDLNDELIQGNKWHKLLPNLKQARSLGHTRLITFGGCYSNHIAATAAAGQQYGFDTIGIIRGPEPAAYSPTLLNAQLRGMQLHFIDRELYRHKNRPSILQSILSRFGEAYLIPEGGSNSLAIEGCKYYARKLNADGFDVLACACGTGGTISGLIAGLDPHRKILGFPVLKNAGFLYQDIEKFLSQNGQQDPQNWSLNLDYHFGGYGKSKPELDDFILNCYRQYGLLLEPVYTGKMLFGLFDLINQRTFTEGTRILAIHSGGLQGLEGFPALKEKLLSIKPF